VNYELRRADGGKCLEQPGACFPDATVTVANELHTRQQVIGGGFIVNTDAGANEFIDTKAIRAPIGDNHV
jgi:hypothetical protein